MKKTKSKTEKPAATAAVETFTPRKLNLLLFLETSCVDKGGLVDMRHMNEEEMGWAREWNDSGLIQFGRLKIADFVGLCTHWVKLLPKSYELAHDERAARGLRSMHKKLAEYPK